MKDASDALWEKMLLTASGEILARNEERNYREIMIFKDGVTL